MIGKTDKNPQLNVFRTPLVSVINMKHELAELAQRIDWKSRKAGEQGARCKGQNSRARECSVRIRQC